MKKPILFLLFFAFLGYSDVFSQGPRVPSEMEFADIRLNLTEAARREIQTHVDALYRSEKYFNVKLERVDLYFPIIERIFQEENLPIDFKYLVIQESALISDAVSSSNAVGFWQFKQASAEEVGLRVDGRVDERLNIVSSTRGAARYLHRNNNFFDNWLYALLSYNLGAGGAQKVVDDKYFGAKKMAIDKSTHWYIIKFLAHKVAFENATGKNQNLPFALVEYQTKTQESLPQIALEAEVDEELLTSYNKWLKRGDIPDDKSYTVIIPAAANQQQTLVAMNNNKPQKAKKPLVVLGHGSNPLAESRFSKGSEKYPLIGEETIEKEGAVLATVNGKPGIIAGPNDNLLTLAEKGEISISRFLRFNDLNSGDKAIAGQVYYLKNKRRRAPEHYHVVLETENLWSVSQKYGIRIKSLRNKNRMDKNEQPKPGRVLWMRFVRPSKEPIEYKEVGNNREEVVAEEDTETTMLASGIDNKDVQEIEEATEEILQREIAQIPVTEVPVQEEVYSQQTESPMEEVQEEGASEDNRSFETDEEIKFVEQTAPLANEEKTVHVVKSGETLYGIARAYGVQLGDLLIWNNLSLKDGINVDQVLKITPPKEPARSSAPKETTPAEPEFFVHEVSSGETLYKIARDHNVTIKDVMLWNNKEDFKVSIGEKLRIKRGE